VTEPLYDGTQDVITEIPIDVRQSSSYSFGSDITEYPVESGAKITDHVHLQPNRIMLEGLVSDSPIVEVPTTLQLRGDQGQASSISRSQAAFDALYQVWEKRLPLTIVTEYRIFEDMMIESFEIPKDRDRGPDGLWFSATFKKISTVRTLSATLPPDVVARLKRKRPKTKAAKSRVDPEKVRRDSAIAQEIATGKTSTPQVPTGVASKVQARL
jgi:hypothetical protein